MRHFDQKLLLRMSESQPSFTERLLPVMSIYVCVNMIETESQNGASGRVSWENQ